MPGQLFTANAARSSASLLIGVRTDSFAFRRAVPIAQDVGGKTYQVLIPFDRSISIVAASPSFQVSEAIGRPLLNSGNAVQVHIPSGQRAPIVDLRVNAKTTSSKVMYVPN